MAQAILPLFIDGENTVNRKISYEKADDGNIYYYLYCQPVGFHRIDDLREFKILTSQLIVNGHCKNCEIVKAFGVSEISVKRSVKKLRTEGIAGFYKQRNTRKGGTVLTPEVIAECQAMLDDNKSRKDIALSLSLKINTLSKAIQSGKLIEHKKKAD